MNKRRNGFLEVALLGLLSSASGCKAMLTSLAETGEWGQMLRAAPTVTNPANGGQPDSMEVFDQQHLVPYRWTTFSKESACFSFVAPFPPQEVTGGAPYALEALEQSMDDRPGYGGDDALKAVNPAIRIVSSHSEVRLVRVWEGRAQVEKPKTFWTTEAVACFQAPKIPTPKSRYLLLYRDGPLGGFASYAVWQLAPTSSQ